MVKLTRRKISALRYSFEKKAFALTGRRFRVCEIKNKEDIGFTIEADEIYLSFDHALFYDLKEQATIRFIQGVFAHEILHKLLSDFGELDRANKLYRGATRRIFGQINNILEDSFIENYASLYLSDILVQDILFMRAHIYKHSEPIGTHESPFAQFVYASIQYGDVGLVKGQFTDELAKKCFAAALPIMDKGLKEPNSRKRAVYSGEILEISRPLWEDEANLEDLLSKLFEDLAKQLRDEGTPSGGGLSGTPLEKPTGEEEMPETGKERRRKITIKRVSKEEYERIKEESEPTSGGLPPDGDITLLVPDEPVENDDEKGSPSESDISFGMPSGEKSEEAETSKGSGSSGEKAEDTEENEGSEDGTGAGGENSDDSKESEASVAGTEGNDTDDENDESGEDKGSETDESSSGSEPKPDTGGKTDDSSSSDSTVTPGGSGEDSHFSEEEDERTLETIEEEYRITDDDVKRIENELTDAEAMIKREEKKESESEMRPPDLPVSDGFKRACKACVCKNIKVANPTDSLKPAYTHITSIMNPDINRLVNQLKRIFRSDVGERSYRTSGKVNIKRLSDNRMTARVFTKNRNPSDRDNIAICILVDESGSMDSPASKISAARLSTIGLAETFAKLDIPLSIIGFTADEGGADAIHYHYINWGNTLKARMRLLSIKARSNNFDGYSVRYASEYLRRRNAEHKILIVISDGYPACHVYCAADGFMDTKLAIKEASRDAVVIGVLLGGENPTVHRELYGYNFLHISDPSDLFKNLGKTIQKLIKNW